MKSVKSMVLHLICLTPLQYWPVRVRSGLAKGARWTAFPFSSNWRTGGSEPDVSAAIKFAGIAAGDVCWDLGAHFGIHTVGLAFLVGETGQIVAFEPDSVAFARLKRHVEINRLPQVKLFNAAASATEGEQRLILSGGLGSTLSHFRYEDEPAPTDWSSGSVRVQTVVLDHLLEAGNLRPPRMIKVDVQGHGAKALRGARKTIERHSPVIIFSSHSPWELEETRDMLVELGYRAVNVQGKTISWESFITGDAILIRD